MVRTAPLIRPAGTFSHKGSWGPQWHGDIEATFLPLREKVDRAERETDEGPRFP